MSAPYLGKALPWGTLSFSGEQTGLGGIPETEGMLTLRPAPGHAARRQSTGLSGHSTGFPQQVKWIVLNTSHYYCSHAARFTNLSPTWSLTFTRAVKHWSTLSLTPILPLRPLNQKTVLKWPQRCSEVWHHQKAHALNGNPTSKVIIRSICPT